MLFVIVAISLIAIFSGCTGKYEPQASSSSVGNPYTIQDRGNGSYLIETTTIDPNNIPELLLGWDEINTKCDIVSFSDLSADNGEAYQGSSSVALLVKVRGCSEKINAIPKN